MRCCALPTIMRFLPSGPKPEPRAHQNQTDTAGSSKWSVGLRELAKLAFPIHPHMLRHGCGFKLANGGVDTRALFTRSQGQRRRKQLIEVVPHNGVAIARNVFERRAIDDVDETAAVADEARALQQASRDGHGGAAHAEHLPEKF